MRIPRSLRKAIAAALALTTFSTTLAGCGSNRGLTTGGLSGKGILGDFAVGGLYGGVFGGFFGDALHPGEDLPKGSFTVELPRPNDERLVVETVGMDALRYYAHARIATELLSRMNAKNSNPEDYVKLLKETAKLWESAERYAEAAQKLGAALAKKETKPDYKSLAMIDRSPFGRDFFFSVAYAREGTDKDEARFGANQSDFNFEEGTRQWAHQIVYSYDKFPAGQKIEGLANQLGVDAKEANRKFQEAVNTTNNLFGTNSNYEDAGKFYDIGTRAAAATKGACQVTLYVGGVILAAPALAAGAAPTIVQCGIAANFGTGGLDTFVEVKNDLHTVLTGDSRPDLDELKKTTGTLSAITSGFVLVTSFSNFSLFGEKAVNATHNTLQAANLNTKGFLDQYKIGGAGVSTFFDSAIWTSERGMELYQEGKFLGIKVIKDKKTGKDIIVPLDKKDLSKELSQASDPELVALLLPREVIAQLMEEVKKEEADLTAEIVQEDARRWDEIGKAEARRRAEIEAELEKNKRNRGGIPRGTVSSISLGDDPKQSSSQQTTENLPYATSKLAGRYTIVNSERPNDFAIRVIIKAQDDKTIRAIRVKNWTDKKGDVFFVARIDPKTGRVLQQGLDLKFSYSEAAKAYTGYMAEQTITDKPNLGLLRMVQH